MTVMSDYWIDDQSNPKQYFVGNDIEMKRMGWLRASAFIQSSGSCKIIEAEPLKAPLIENYVDHSVSYKDDKKIPSYGLSSYGYDLRIGRNYKIFDKKTVCINEWVSSVSDTKRNIIDSEVDTYVTEYNDKDSIIIPPHTFALGHTEEKLNIPRDILVTFMPKSTVTRAGLLAMVTPGEPEWSGYITIELANLTSSPIILESGSGIMQAIFQQGNEPCHTSYLDRQGKYQNQDKTPVFPR